MPCQRLATVLVGLSKCVSWCLSSQLAVSAAALHHSHADSSRRQVKYLIAVPRHRLVQASDARVAPILPDECVPTRRGHHDGNIERFVVGIKRQG
eukprot:COSAG06_NODE_44826_length_360_cov_0.670498_2_plen_94_part_01